jgi:hypothetical protein
MSASSTIDPSCQRAAAMGGGRRATDENDAQADARGPPGAQWQVGGRTEIRPEEERAGAADKWT